MDTNYIELKINRSFGDIITTWFEFFKRNVKPFTNMFIRFNGIFLIAFLIISYLLVSGIMGMFTRQNGYLYNNNTAVNEDYVIYFMVGIILFVIIFMIMTALNFSLSSIYISLYEKNKGANFDKKEIRRLLMSRLGSIIGFILLLIPIYLVFGVISVVISFIPLAGMVAQYMLQFSISAWIGVSFINMIYEGKGVTDALGEGWTLVMKNFWKSVGVNFVMGLLIGILIVMVLTVPGIIIGIYTYHAVSTNVVITDSIFAKLIYTLGTCCFFVLLAYSQCLSQLVNGILYFDLHEKTYNTNLRSKIENIGQ